MKNNIKVVINIVVLMCLAYPNFGQTEEGDSCGNANLELPVAETFDMEHLVCVQKNEKDPCEENRRARKILYNAMFAYGETKCSNYRCSDKNNCREGKERCVAELNVVEVKKLGTSCFKTTGDGDCGDENQVAYKCSGSIENFRCSFCCEEKKGCKVYGRQPKVRLKVRVSRFSTKNFTAKSIKEGTLLNRRIGSEPDGQGFRIWRAISNFANYCDGCSRDIDNYKEIKVLNKAFGSKYSYLDKDTEPGIKYCYALENIDSTGKSSFYFNKALVKVEHDQFF